MDHVVRVASAAVAATLLMAGPAAGATRPRHQTARTTTLQPESTCGFSDVTLEGTPGDDTLVGTDGIDVIDGRGGNDSIDGAGGPDILCGNEGNDTIVGGDDGDTLIGGAGDDTHDGDDGNDYVWYDFSPGGVTVDLSTGTASGGDGNDRLVSIENISGSHFADTLTGDLENNAFYGEGGDDTIVGGDGTDYVYFDDAPNGVKVDLARGLATGVGRDSLTSIEGAQGSRFRDTLRGDSASNPFTGNGGNDSISGAGGFDFVEFEALPASVRVNLAAGTARGQGADELRSMEGITGSPRSDILIGGKGTNTIQGGGGNDRLSGRGGFDWAVYDFAPAAVDADLGAGTVRGQGRDLLAGIEGISGSQFDDVLTGSSRSDGFYGLDGDDVINGKGAFDWMYFDDAPGPIDIESSSGTATGFGTDSFSAIEGVVGSQFDDNFAGDDRDNYFAGGGGDDTFDGASGTDIAYFSFSPSPITADLSSGEVAGEGADQFTSVEGIVGSPFDDVITGSSADDYIEGSAGDDRLSGGAGNDYFAPGPGNDTADGGDGTYDMIDFFANASMDVNLTTGVATGEGRDKLSNLEGVGTADKPDVIVGDAFGNFLFGWGGGDRITAGDGDDEVEGGGGSDIIDAGRGRDSCAAGESLRNCEGKDAATVPPLLDEALQVVAATASFRRNH